MTPDQKKAQDLYLASAFAFRQLNRIERQHTRNLFHAALAALGVPTARAILRLVSSLS